MIVESCWLVYQAGRLLLGPVAERVLADFQQDAADRIRGAIRRLVRGDVAPDEDVQPTAPADGADVAVTDTSIVETLEENPRPTGELRGKLEEILGIHLGGPEVAAGTDAWFVSAYEAVLWRAAVMAGWEGRPIAVKGALQGPEWVTVCVPDPNRRWGAGQIIDPSSIWSTDTGDRHRVVGEVPLVDFYVRRVEDTGQAATDTGKLNRQFIRTRRFDPGPASSITETWHRVDGLNRGWVLFQWDDALREHIQKLREPARPLNGRGYLFPVNLDKHPPRWDECPEDWQLLMEIPDEVAGIAALSNGVDSYAAASSAVAAAVRALLDRNRPG